MQQVEYCIYPILYMAVRLLRPPLRTLCEHVALRMSRRVALSSSAGLSQQKCYPHCTHGTHFLFLFSFFLQLRTTANGKGNDNHAFSYWSGLIFSPVSSMLQMDVIATRYIPIPPPCPPLPPLPKIYCKHLRFM